MPYTVIEITGQDRPEIDAKIAPYSEMSPSEREFLRMMVKRYQPHKALEVGVAQGASSAVILDAMRGGGQIRASFPLTI